MKPGPVTTRWEYRPVRYGNYDSWKLASPDDDYEEIEELCTVCDGTGWIVGTDQASKDLGMIFPCTECCEEMTLDALEEMVSD